MPAHHILKTHPAVYEAAKRGDKNFEVRKDDRQFQTGDTVTLVWYDPQEGLISPDQLDARLEGAPEFRIGFVLRGGQYGVEPGYVAFSLLPL